MLVTDDKGDDANEGVSPSLARVPDGPPPYDPAPQLPRTQTSSSASSTLRRNGPSLRGPTRPKPPDIPASNFLKIKRTNGSAKGTYVINADLQVPVELVSGAAAAAAAASESSKTDAVNDLLPDTRKNFSIECTNGSISSDVWLVSDETNVDRELDGRKAELDLRSQNGSVNVRLNSITTRPFALNAYSKNGSVSVALPSDFVGPVTLTAVNGSVSLSETVKSRLMMFSEESGKRNCFIGDFRRANYTGRQNWTGSTVDVASHNGRVKLCFVNEGEERSANGSGFLRRLFRS